MDYGCFNGQRKLDHTTERLQGGFKVPMETGSLLVTVGVGTDLVSAPVPGGDDRHTESHPCPGKIRLAGRAVKTRRKASGNAFHAFILLIIGRYRHQQEAVCNR